MPVKQVNGYMSGDGTFFESALDAELHDAITTLTSDLTHVYKIDPAKFLYVLHQAPEAVKRCCEAHLAISAAQSQRDELERQSDVKAVQQFKAC